MTDREKQGLEYLADILGERVPRGGWHEDLLPPTHPRGPHRMRDVPRGPAADVVLTDDPFAPPAGWPPAVRHPEPLQPLAIRYAPEVVAEMRRRFGGDWPAEPPMLERRRPVGVGPPWDQPDANPVADLQAFMRAGRDRDLAVIVDQQRLEWEWAAQLWAGMHRDR